MQSLLQDLRYGLRMLTKNPSFTALALLTLALGIGANTAIFTVVNAVLFRPLPYPQPDSLIMVSGTNPKRGQERLPLSVADFLDLKTQNQVFETLAVYANNLLVYTGGETPEQIPGAAVSTDFFTTLRVPPVIGRSFLPEDERPESPPVVLVSHSFWRRHLNSDPVRVGQFITLNGRVSTVIGVMPPDFEFEPQREIGIWGLFKPAPPSGRGPSFLNGIARLKPDRSQEQAKSELATIARRIQEQNPSIDGGWSLTTIDLHEVIVRGVRAALFLLLAAVVFVLLIASANIANLLLSRAASREREIAVRRALGASRGRVIRQLLTESLLLAGIGSIVGVLLASWSVDLLLALIPESVPRLQGVRMDSRVVGFTVVISLVSGLLFGLAPALQGSRLDLNRSLKESGLQGSDSSGSHRMRHVLVIAEISLSLILLIGAGLMIKSFMQLQRVSVGVNPDRVLTMQINVRGSRYGERLPTFYQQLLEKVEALPGVQSAGLTLGLPLNLSLPPREFSIEGRLASVVEGRPITDTLIVSPDYFQVLGAPLMKGRGFAETDQPTAPRVAIVNETMARRYFSNENPLGKRIRSGGADSQSPWIEIVGVVGDIKYAGLEAESRSTLYLPLWQNPAAPMNLVVRTSADPLTLVPSIRNELLSLDKEVPVTSIRTMEQLIYRAQAQPRFRTLLLGFFGSMALLLAAVGIYGVMSYSVTQRTREIGIRMALGAHTGDVLKLVIWQGTMLTLAGVGIGLFSSFALMRLMERLLFGVSATDPLTFVLITALLTMVALLACYMPARRATKVDPIVALRYE